jgi:hypothetical protein
VRSTQSELPLALAPAPRGAVRRRGLAARRTTFRIGAELSAARGWPAGTEVRIDPEARPGRGDVVLVVAGPRRVAGTFERRFGRSVLVNDRGVTWLGPDVEVLGVVVAAAPPLFA